MRKKVLIGLAALTALITAGAFWLDSVDTKYGAQFFED
jgi:hypothetical protein